MLAFDVAAIWLVADVGPDVWCGAMAAPPLVAVVLAGVLGGASKTPFGFWRLWAYGLFLHAPCCWPPPRSSGGGVRGWPPGAGRGRNSPGRRRRLSDRAALAGSHPYRIASPKVRRPLRIVVAGRPADRPRGPYECDAFAGRWRKNPI